MGASRKILISKNLVKLLGGGLGCNLCFYYRAGCQVLSIAFSRWVTRNVSCMANSNTEVLRFAQDDNSLMMTIKLSHCRKYVALVARLQRR
jgi:hypothetical protein